MWLGVLGVGFGDLWFEGFRFRNYGVSVWRLRADGFRSCRM